MCFRVFLNKMSLNMNSRLYLSIFPTQIATCLEDKPLNCVCPSADSCLLHTSTFKHLTCCWICEHQLMLMCLVCLSFAPVKIQDKSSRDQLRRSKMPASSVLPAFLLSRSCARMGRSPQYRRAMRFGQGPQEAWGRLWPSIQKLIREMQCQTDPTMAERGWMPKSKPTHDSPQSPAAATPFFKSTILSATRRVGKDSIDRSTLQDEQSTALVWSTGRSPESLRARHWGQSCLAVPAQGGQGALYVIKCGYFFLLVACFFFNSTIGGGSICAMRCKPEGL